MTTPPTPSPASISVESASDSACRSAAYPVTQRLLRPTRPHRPATVDGRLTDRAATGSAHLAFLANHLTARDRWLARVIGEYRVFTTTQLTHLTFASARMANQRLLRLYQWRILDRFQPLLAVGSAPMHYVLDLAGAAVLAAEDGLDLDQLAYRRDRAVGIGHSLRLAHTLGVNGLYAALVAIARHTTSHTDTDVDGRGSRAVTAWWSETRCARLWGDLARPDAYGRWHENGREVDFFLEYDTGTEPLTRVAGKLHDYARLAAATGIVTPILFWFPTPAREAAARAALAATRAALDRPGTVPVATTAAEPAPAGEHAAPGPAVPDSPAGARWLPLSPSGRPDARPATERVRLARLTWTHTGKPDATALRGPAASDLAYVGADASSTGGRAPASARGPVGLAEPEPMPPAAPSAHPNPDPAGAAATGGRSSDPRRCR